MALSLENFHGWSVNNVAQAPTSTVSAAPAATQLEAREGPSHARWQAVKDEIRILYEKKPLKDVRRIMEQRHGFRATERMYKARLAQWGFSKNYSDRDYQICAVLAQARLQSGKRHTAFNVNGHKRSLKDLHKYIKGRKMTEDEFLAAAHVKVNYSDLAELQQDQQYAHVRAYTPEPEAEADDQQQLPVSSLSSAHGGSPSLGRHPGEIATGLAKHSPTGAAPLGSVSGGPDSGPSSTQRNSPTSQKLTPYDTASPTSPTTPATEWTPSSRRTDGAQFTPTDNAFPSAMWPSHYSPSTRPPPASSPMDGSSLYGPSFMYPASNATSGSQYDDQASRAGSVYASSPGRLCTQLGRDVDFMALQILEAPPLKSLCGHDDIRAWRLVSDTSSEGSDDFEHICPTCHDLTSNHFVSLPNLELPQQSRSLLNDSPDQTESAMSLPTSSRGHEHSWKWVARCFAACIYMGRGDERMSHMSLQDADAEFEKMLVPVQDPKVILALHQTVSILLMHDQKSTTQNIMLSALSVAQRVLGPDDPVTVMVRWMVHVSCPGKMSETKNDVTSATLGEIHQFFVRRYGYRDPRSIATMYCHGYMLNVERRLPQAEQVLREVYAVSCAVFGRQHLQSISALTNLHRCLERQDRIDEAIGVLLTATSDSRETLGVHHPRRLESLRLLGVLYQRQGQADLTEDIYWKVLKGQIKMLGRNHTFTQGVKVALEKLLKERGKWGVERPRPKQEDDDERGGEPPSGTKFDHDDTKMEETDVELDESEAQIRLHDLFEWDAEETWDDSGSADGSEDTRSQYEAY